MKLTRDNDTIVLTTQDKFGHRLRLEFDVEDGVATLVEKIGEDGEVHPCGHLRRENKRKVEFRYDVKARSNPEDAAMTFAG